MADDSNELMIPAGYVSAALALLRKRGLATHDLLERVGLGAADLDDPAARVEVARLVHLLSERPELVDDLAVAFELGYATKPTAHGTLGYALLTSASIRDAIALGERFLRLRFRMFRIRFFVEGDDAVLDVAETASLGRYHGFAFAWIAGALSRIGEVVLGDRFDRREVEVRLSFPTPAAAPLFLSHFERTTFGCDANQARLPLRWLDYPLELSDPIASRSALRELERELALHEEESDVVERVRALFDDPEFGFGDLEAAASRLHVSARTLRRHLQREGATYQELLADARKARALARLRDPAISIEQIAEELGYSDQANFTRAFHKWTGKTPGAMRRK